MKLPQAIDVIDSLQSPGDGAPPAASPTIVGGLFKAQAKKVRNFLTFRLKSADDADDAAQDVFLKLWRHEKSGHLREEATAYMFSAAYSAATDLERHRVRHQHEVLDDLDSERVAEDQPALEEQRHWRDALAHLVSELKLIPDAHRKAFVLHHFKGLSYTQIAKKMGVSTRTVERHMVQAHRELEIHMKDFL